MKNNLCHVFDKKNENTNSQKFPITVIYTIEKAGREKNDAQ